MWITKLKLRHEDCPIVSRCERFNVAVFSYPRTWYQKDGEKFATTTCYFWGGDRARKEEFLKDLEKDRRISQMEASGDIFTYEINLGMEGEHVMLYHTCQIFFVKPTVNHPDGHEYWEVASWKKEVLQAFIEDLAEHMDVCVILKMERSSLEDVHFPNVLPKLSKGQKRALEIAYANGYYRYPRDASLETLARVAGLSISTFQEHLRKAEAKLLPVLIEQRLCRE